MSGYRLDSPRFVVGAVSGAHFLSHFYQLVFPPLFPFFRTEFGMSNTQLGLLYSLLFLMPTLLQVPIGDLVDRVGATRIFVVGTAVTGLGTSATALADSYLALLGFVVLAGVGQSVFHPADFALLEAVTDETNRGKAFGTHTFAGFLGFAVGPVVAGVMGVQFGWRVALAVLGVVGVVYAIGVHLSMAPVHRGRDAETDDEDDAGGLRSNWTLLADPRILLTFVLFGLLTVSSTGIQSFTVIFLTDVSDLGVAVANTILSVTLGATAAGVLAGGVLVDRLGIYGIIAAALVVAAALSGVISAGLLPPAFLGVFAVFAVLGFVHGLTLPSRDSIVSEFSSADSTGKSFGIAYTGLSIGGFVAPVMLGFVSDTVNNRAIFAFIGLAYVAALLVVAAVYLGYARGRPTPAGA